MLLPITMTTAAACALLTIWLATRIMRLRIGRKVLVGDAGDPLLLARMRAQANFTEYTPFFLILLGLVEMAKGSALWLWGVSILYVVARVLHAFGMDRQTTNPMRAIGAVVTWLLLAGIAVYGLTLTYGAASPPRPVVTTIG